MNQIHATLIAAACALALSACGGESKQSAETASTPPPAAAPAEPAAPAAYTPAADVPATDVPAADVLATEAEADAAATATAPADAGAATDATADAASAAPAASAASAATGCATEVEGNDMIQYNVSSIVVPSSCSEFTITLKHTGKLPVAAMGHNVVVTAASDMAGVAADGIAAGASAGYLKAGDDRVIAATDMVGGGETSSVTFDVARISGSGPFQFFCSFPGHSALMKGTISVG